MEFVGWIGVGCLVVLLALLSLFVRRAVIARGNGTIEVSLRLTTLVPGRGWSPGLGRFAGDDLRWYRVFSLSPRPRRVLTRYGLAVRGRRRPDGPECVVLPADWIVIRCVSRDQPVDIAMAEPTLTGFLSWLEAAPPGGSSERVAAR